MELIDVAGIKVTVLMGGAGDEAEVSRSSALGVCDALSRAGFSAETLELDERSPIALAGRRPDVVFPALHGSLGEDGSVQGMLNCLNLPYVGSGVAASACGMDKPRAKALFRTCGIVVTPEVTVAAGDDVDSAVDRVLRELGTDVVIKPAAQGSSIGTEFASSREEIGAAVGRTQRFGTVLIEPRIRGREVTVGILDLTGPEALPPLEIVTPQGSWYDYQHRYTPGLSEHRIPADITDRDAAAVRDAALLAHATLGCRDLSRADFIVPTDGQPVLLEVNTMPGMTPTSLFPDCAEAAGYKFDELVTQLVLQAHRRHES